MLGGIAQQGLHKEREQNCAAEEREPQHEHQDIGCGEGPVGEKVQVDFSPLRDTSLKGGALKKLTIVDTGQVLTANIRAQEMPGLE